MSAYAEPIKRIVPELDPRHVEAYMRLEYGTLDHLSASRFASEARTAASCVVMGGTDEAESLAISYGL